MDTRVLYPSGLELKNGGFLPGGSMDNFADADILGKIFPRRGFMNSVLLSICLALHTLSTVLLAGQAHWIHHSGRLDRPDCGALPWRPLGLGGRRAAGNPIHACPEEKTRFKTIQPRPGQFE
jgi:hypothetical protein